MCVVVEKCTCAVGDRRMLGMNESHQNRLENLGICCLFSRIYAVAKNWTIGMQADRIFDNVSINDAKITLWDNDRSKGKQQPVTCPNDRPGGELVSLVPFRGIVFEI